MRTAMVAILVLAVVAPLAAFPAAAERLPERGAPVVEIGTTQRFDGGAWITVRIGDVSVGVIWSTTDTTRAGVSLFVDYVRYFGGAELYDEQGTYLRTVGLPLHTVLMQHFGQMVEFRDVDGDSLFDLRVQNRTTFPSDLPVKELSLNRAWYLDGEVDQTVTDDAAWVNFTLSTDDVPYRAVFDPAIRGWRPGVESDGVLEKISLTFHLSATAETVTRAVPFYKVTLTSGNEREPTGSEFLGNRTMQGVSLAVDGKYDQLIEGWDFSPFDDAKLAMGTFFSFGNFINRPVVHWLQHQFGGACLRDGTYRHCESDEGPSQPVKIARDTLTVAEDWHRAGRMYWVSDVEVDGQPDTMTFEIYHAAPVTINRGDRLYSGFRAYGAFVYPQGQTIYHDPGLGATSLLTMITEATNLAPSVLVALQLAVVAVALVPALLLRRRANKGRR